MNTAEYRALAIELESAVEAVPGVTQVFRRGVVVHALTESAQKLLGAAALERPLVTVTADGVAVTIGVSDDRPAMAVVHDVYTAVRAELDRLGSIVSVIDVQVGRIQSR